LENYFFIFKRKSLWVLPGRRFPNAKYLILMRIYSNKSQRRILNKGIERTGDGDRPHVVKKFSYSSGTNSAISALTINKMPAVPSNSEVDEMLSQNGLKELCKDFGTFISGRKPKIDGQDCGEITFKMTREATVGTFYMYSLYYYLIYKDKIIVLSYTTGSTTDDKAKQMFEDYKTLFRGLAGNTGLFSKWE
jgi:hypothetical protein